MLLKIHTAPSIPRRPSDKAQVYYTPKSVALSPRLNTFDEKLKLVEYFRGIFKEKLSLKTARDHAQVKLRGGVYE